MMTTWPSFILLMLGAASLTACGTSQSTPRQATRVTGLSEETYTHLFKSPRDFQRDSDACKSRADQALALAQRGQIPSATFANYGRYIYEDCLDEHGWQKVDTSGSVDFPVNIMLIKAAQEGNERMVRLLIAERADVSATASRSFPTFGKGYTALYAASEKGHAGTVRLLLSSGANPNTQMPLGACCPGWTPLMIAAAERHSDTVTVLLAAGADVNARNSLGRTALMFAAINGDAATGKALLERGADVNVVPADTTGRPALTAAAMNGHLEVVRLLLDKRANTSVRDNEGRTALGWARTRGFTAVSNLLETRGATE